MSSITSELIASLASHRGLDETSDPCNSNPAEISSYDQRLHKISILILFVGSALGVAVPVLPKFHKRLGKYPYLIVLGKCAGTGVMISCSLVHMILPSTEALTNECLPTLFSSSYPAFSYAFAVAAALLSHFSEFFLFNFVLGSHPFVEIPAPTIEGGNDGNQDDVTNQEDCDCGSSVKRPCDHDDANAEAAAKNKRMRQLTECLMTEFSLSVHSVFVGLSLGVSEGSTLVALMIALVFHQLLEGVALGCRLADSLLGPWTIFLFGLIFSISCPVGIVIGISVYSSLNPNSQSLLLMQGIFDGICGGLLLYMGFQMLLIDFQQDLEKFCQGSRRNVMIIGMFAVLWLSAISMSLIGAWA